MFVLIGGAPFRDTPERNAYLASLLQPIRDSGKKPYILYMPQACYESKPSVNSFHKAFTSAHKCKTSAALWAHGENSRDRLIEKFELADMIYIGGGRYDLLLQEFEKMNIKELLDNAIRQGKIIVGNSAGAMILCKQSVSDYLIVSGAGDNHSMVKGYGYIDASLCPHAEEESRQAFIASQPKELLPSLICLNSDQDITIE